MKKFLLLAATAAMVASATAQVPCSGTLKLDWKVAKDKMPAPLETRQGFGLNGKFYIQNKSTKSIEVYDQNGKTSEVLPTGGQNTAISYDDAGNILVGNSAFPNAWRTDSTNLKIIAADGKSFKDITIKADGAVINGRCDFMGKASGNLLSEDGGVLWLVGGTNTGVVKVPVAEGVIDTDNVFEATVDGAAVTASTSTVVNAYTDAEGNAKMLYVTRNANPVVLEGDETLTGTAIALPNKGACNGAFPFTLGGYNLVAYPTLPNYLDGFAIAEAGAEAAVVSHAAEFTANPNGIQANWINVEPVDALTANVYQYVPGGFMAKYTFTLDKSITGVDNAVADKTVAGVKYYNLAGIESATPFSGVNVKVINYTDGSKKAVKVVK